MSEEYREALDLIYPEKVGTVCYTNSIGQQWHGVIATPYTTLGDFFKTLQQEGWRIDLLEEVEITIEGVGNTMDGTQFTMTRGPHGENRTVWVMSDTEKASMTRTGIPPRRST